MGSHLDTALEAKRNDAVIEPVVVDLGELVWGLRLMNA